MDTTQYHDEELRQLFRQLPVEQPAAGFAARVMTQVAFEKQRAANRKRIRLIAWAVSIPCSLALLIVAGFFTRPYWEIYLRKYFEPLLSSLNHAISSLSHTLSSITELFANSGSMVLLTGFMFLALLLGDLFFRRLISSP